MAPPLTRLPLRRLHDSRSSECVELEDELEVLHAKGMKPCVHPGLVFDEEFEDNDLLPHMHYNGAVSRGLTDSGSVNSWALNGAKSPGRPSFDASSAYCKPGSRFGPH